MKHARFLLIRLLLLIPMALGAFSARVTLSALFTAITGRYGGGVFRAWKGLTVLGVLPSTVTNPNTAPQVKARELLSYLSKQWAILAFAVKDQWDAVAAYLTDQWDNFENEVGSHTVIRTQRGPFTGLDALVSAHSLLGSIDEWDSQDALIAAPVAVTAPSQPLDVVLAGDTDGITITWLDPASWGTNGTAGDVRVWAKSEDGTFFAQMSVFAAAGVQNTIITTLNASGGGQSLALTVGAYFIQLDAINEEGLRSAPSAVARILLAAPV